MFDLDVGDVAVPAILGVLVLLAEYLLIKPLFDDSAGGQTVTVTQSGIVNNSSVDNRTQILVSNQKNYYEVKQGESQASADGDPLVSAFFLFFGFLGLAYIYVATSLIIWVTIVGLSFSFAVAAAVSILKIGGKRDRLSSYALHVLISSAVAAVAVLIAHNVKFDGKSVGDFRRGLNYESLSSFIESGQESLTLGACQFLVFQLIGLFAAMAYSFVSVKSWVGELSLFCLSASSDRLGLHRVVLRTCYSEDKVHLLFASLIFVPVSFLGVSGYLQALFDMVA